MSTRASIARPNAGRVSGWAVAIFVIAGLHILGWGLLFCAVVPADVQYSASGAAALAVGVSAYSLGARHAFDADHIAAIDNTTRRLQDRGRPAATVGLWFSLGHSTVVIALCAALAVGITAAGRAITDEDSAVHEFAGVWGPTVSGLFLLIIAAINVISLYRTRRDDGQPVGGPVWWMIKKFEAVVDRPSRMYGVGLAFGLGFDTATEIGLLAMAGAATLGHVPWWAVMTLPLLFAAGMSLLDTAQGALMRRAYAWSPATGVPVSGTPIGGVARDEAESSARRRPAMRYAMVMTGISAVVAVLVAMVQLAGVGADEFGIGGPVAAIAGADLETLGLWFTGILLSLWVILAAAVFLTGRRVKTPAPTAIEP